MISRHRVLGIVPLTLLIALGGILPLRSARGQAGAAPEAHAAVRPAPSPDEAAIRAVDEAFVREYNNGDAKALAAMFTEDADVAEADGARYQGRDLIERTFAETFAEAKGTRIALEIGTIRFLTTTVAKEEGRSILTPHLGAPVARYYTVLYVKRDNGWQMTSVREEPDPLLRPHDRLKELEWMVGDWVDESPDSETLATCRWSADGNFLLRDFTLKRDGKVVMTVHQRVGWDPVAGEFRSWEFDSEGGFGEGHWSRDGDRWIIKQTGVRPEGVSASSTRVTVRVRPDLAHWKLFDQVIGGDAIPGEQSSVLTRVPPRPSFGSSDQPAPGPSAPSSPSPTTGRSQR